LRTTATEFSLVRAFILYNRTFIQGIITEIDIEYTEEEMLAFMETVLLVQEMKGLKKKIMDEGGHIAHMPARTVLVISRGQYTPQKEIILQPVTGTNLRVPTDY
jgi:hypothetical protein